MTPRKSAAFALAGENDRSPSFNGTLRGATDVNRAGPPRKGERLQSHPRRLRSSFPPGALNQRGRF